MKNLQIDIPMEKIQDFCRRWRITEFSLFGSVLRDDFGPDSDVDVLVDFEPDVPWSLFEWVDMIEELKGIVGREVEVVDKTAIRKKKKRKNILSSHEVVYAA